MEYLVNERNFERVVPFLILMTVLAGCGTGNKLVDAGSSPDANPGSSPSADAGTQPAHDAGPPCVEPTSGLPTDVFCTGLYKDHDTTKHELDVMPYTPGVTLWSDGADKQRYLLLPAGSQIDTSNIDVWKFPVGTKAWKEFRFSGKLVETRLFWKRDDTTWESGTYIWDDSGKTAALNTSRQPVLIASGYEIPTAKDCAKCHHGGADKLLGVEAVALALPTAKGVTLSKLASAGSLSHPPVTTAITLPEDSSGKAGWALGYLHANCGMPCHSTRGLGHETELVMRLRADEFWPAGGGSAASPAVSATDTYKATVNQMAITQAVVTAFPGANRITPGAHDKSLIWLLAHRRGEYQMPPLVSHQIDEEGTQKLADWLDSLKP